MIAETYMQLVTDPAHILFELTLEAVTGVVGLTVTIGCVALFGRRPTSLYHRWVDRFIERHERRYHKQGERDANRPGDCLRDTRAA